MTHRRIIRFSLLVFACGAWLSGECDSGMQKADNNQPQSVTLLNRARHQAYDQSVFSFQFGANGEAGRKLTRNRWNLLYGSLSLDHDSDYFQVRSGKDDCSRIIDLGEKRWDEIDEKAVLADNPLSEKLIPCSAMVQVASPRSGQNINDLNAHVAKALKGHLYFVHNLERETNLYTLFRVDELVPSDTCTISWKVIKRGKKPS
jgi:hypothetical protein